MVRLAIVTNIPTPYRKGFFRALSSCPDLSPTVFYCASIERGRNWGEQFGVGYAHRLLRGITLGASFHINPSLPIELARGDFEIVVVGGYSYPSAVLAIMTSRVLGCKVIMWLDGPIGSRASLLNRMLRGLVDHYIVASTKARESLLRLGIEPQRIDIVPLTVDIKAWGAPKSSLPTHLGHVSTGELAGKVVLFCGRFVPAKNIGFVIELASRMKDLREVSLLLVGDGPLLNSSRQRCQAYGLRNVLFAGSVPPEQLPGVFARSEMLLLPSLYEPWGAVVNEALAAGIPVMVSEVAGAADLVRHGENGYIIDPRNVDRAELLLREYLANDTLREQMKHRAKVSGIQLSHEIAASLFARTVHGLASRLPRRR